MSTHILLVPLDAVMLEAGEDALKRLAELLNERTPAWVEAVLVPGMTGGAVMLPKATPEANWVGP